MSKTGAWSNIGQPIPSTPMMGPPPPGYTLSQTPNGFPPPSSPVPSPVAPQFFQPAKHPGSYPMAPQVFNANHTVHFVHMPSPALGPRSSRMICPNCKSDVESKVEYEAGRMTHIVAAVICLFGCVCCICLPYISNDFKDATHYCPHCRQLIGTYKR